MVMLKTRNAWTEPSKITTTITKFKRNRNSNLFLLQEFFSSLQVKKMHSLSDLRCITPRYIYHKKTMYDNFDLLGDYKK